jgi:S1-C subfamily serine protease
MCSKLFLVRRIENNRNLTTIHKITKQIRMFMFKNLIKLTKKLVLFSIITSAVFFSGNIKDAYYRDYIGDAVVRIMDLDKQGGGTGFHVEADSGKTYILTNAHICEVAKNGKLLVEKNGEEMVRNVIKVYEQHDLCLVEAMPEPEGVLEIADSLDQGDDIILIGHPGLRNLTLSHGEFIGQDIVQLINHKINSKEECLGRWMEHPMFLFLLGKSGVCIESFVTSAISSPSYGGNSGSPVVNKYGNVVGVLFAGSQQVHDAHMVPLNNVKDFLKGF